ncbi:hypothetical protein GCM10009734_97020 [Nonomuraea bangladeshensis]
MRSHAAQESASEFGQEPWAQQALAVLRRARPDWAFLVVRYRWLAMRGKHVMISAPSPGELEQTLSSISPKIVTLKSDSAVTGVSRRGTLESSRVLPISAELPTTERRTKLTVPPPLGADAAGAAGGDAGPGLSGTLTPVGPPSGVLAAERSGTDTWAIAAAGPVRVRRPHGWLRVAMG